MAVTIGKYADEWTRAKKAFEKNTKSKKPSETFLKISLKSGLAAKFKKIDEAYLVFRNGANDKKDPLKIQLAALETLDKALLDAKKSCASYVKVVNTAWEKEVKGKGSKMKLDSLNVLEKDMEAIIVSCMAQLNMFRKTTGVKGKEMAAAVRSLDVLGKNLDGSLKKGALFVAQNQRNSNLSEDEALNFFRDGINTAARDINQNVGNIGKLYPPNSKEAKTAAKLFQVMKSWAADGKGAPDVKKMSSIKDMMVLNTEMKRRITVIAGWRKTLTPPTVSV